MTKAYVAEYVRLKLVSGPGGAVAQCPEEEPIAEYIVDYTAGHAESAAINPKTKFLCVRVDSIANRCIGTAPVAAVASGSTGSGRRMPADSVEYIGMPPDHGDGTNGTRICKISFITNT
jgi:hypothetical protein